MTDGIKVTEPQTQQLGASEERLWAMLAHVSILLNLVTGFLGVFAALLIYLLFRDRSRYVAYQSLQAFIFQLITWGGGGVIIGVIWAVVAALSVLIVGVVLIPGAILLTIFFGLMPLLGLCYGVAAAIQANRGQDFKYWLIGDWLRSTLTGQ